MGHLTVCPHNPSCRIHSKVGQLVLLCLWPEIRLWFQSNPGINVQLHTAMKLSTGLWNVNRIDVFLFRLKYLHYKSTPSFYNLFLNREVSEKL